MPAESFEFAIELETFIGNGAAGLVNGINSPTIRARNGATFRAAFAAAKTDTTSPGPAVYGGRLILLPPGDYYVDSAFEIPRGIILRGAGNLSRIIFPNDSGGLILQSYNDTGRTTQALLGTLENFRCLTQEQASFEVFPACWAPGKVLTVGTVRAPSYVAGGLDAIPWGHAYRVKAVTGDATTSANYNLEPTWHSNNQETIFAESLPKSATFTGGSATITVNSHGWSVGQSVRLEAGSVPGGFAVLTDYWIVSTPTANTLTLSATSGGSAIVASTAGSSVTLQRTTVALFPDIVETTGTGSITWERIRAHGLEVRATGWTIRNVAFHGFYGNGIHLNASNTQYCAGTSCNSTSLENVEAYNVGGSSIFFYGSDANAVQFSGRNMFHGARQHPYYGRSLGARNQPTGCFFDTSEAGIWSNLDVFRGCYNELGNSPVMVLLASAEWHDGTMGGGLGAGAGLVQVPAVPSGHWQVGFSEPRTWSAGMTGVTQGEIVRPTGAGSLGFNNPTGQLWYAVSVTTGVTGGSEPAWYRGTVSLIASADEPLSRKDIVDGGVTWRPWGRDEPSTGYYSTSKDRASGKTFENFSSSTKIFFTAGGRGSTAHRAFSYGSYVSTVDNGEETAYSWDAVNLYWVLLRGSTRKAMIVTGHNHALGSGVLGTRDEFWFETSTTSTATPPSGASVRYDADTQFRYKTSGGRTRRLAIKGTTTERDGSSGTGWPYAATADESRINVRSINASRTVTLPALSTMVDDQPFEVGDADGSVAGANTIVVDGNGAEPISGAATKTITTAWGQIQLRAYPTRNTWVMVGSVGTIT